jgi:glyoxylase-like metal-dependent hydrolase (beta-lactamase superfamily II)
MTRPITLTHRSTHCYLLPGPQVGLLVDAGFPGTLPALVGRLRAYQLDLAAIRWVLATHYHPDHAGLVQELKQAAGVRLVIHPAQIPFLAELGAFYAREARRADGFVPIRVEPGDVTLAGDGRAELRALGFAGRVLLTPGHSDDSLTLLLDDGQAFVGDLPAPLFAAGDRAPAVRASWQALLDAGARTIYPSHAASFPAGRIAEQLAAAEGGEG